jgi:uncharacterized protein
MNHAPSQPDPGAALYPARVMHRRHVAPLYRFVYRIFYVLIDIDRLDEVAHKVRGFSVDRFNLASLRRRDFGDQSGNLRGWAEALLATHGVTLQGGRIRLLALPRLLGFGFNPISLWYCDHADGTPRAVIAEVHNTFGERHHYVLASGGEPLAYEGPHTKEKCFHVSPFFDLVGRYQFALSAPDERLRVAIHETRDDAPLMDAILAAERKPFTTGTLLSHSLRMPLMTLKVVVGIHWEALKLWLRGARYHPKPSPPNHESS